eukprot:10319831-Alexandrium_andersonii.AAC.1
MLLASEGEGGGLGSQASGVSLDRVEEAMQDVADREALDWAREHQERQEAMAVPSRLGDEAHAAREPYQDP